LFFSLPRSLSAVFLMQTVGNLPLVAVT